MKFIIPKEIVEREAGTGDEVFPEGTWEGTIEVVRIQNIHQGDKADFFLGRDNQYFAEECEVASLQLGEITAVLAGQKDVGKRKYFDENIMLSYDGNNWDEYADYEGSPTWQLGVTQRRLTKLASALALVDESSEGIGPVDHFNDLFRATDENTGLNGMKVRFKVTHRKFKRRDGTEGKESMIAQYYPAP